MNNILRIAAKDFRRQTKSWRANLLGIMLPIAFMTIFSLGLSSVFTGGIKFSHTVVYYESGGNVPLASAFAGLGSASRAMGIEWKAIDGADSHIDEKAALADVANDNAVGLVKPENGGLHFYKNDRGDIEAKVVASMLDGLAERYKSTEAIAGLVPEAILAAEWPVVAESPVGTAAPVTTASDGSANSVSVSGTADYSTESTLEPKRGPTSTDYFAITMLTLFTLYAAMAGMWSIRSERTGRTILRLRASPIGPFTLFWGKLGGSLVVVLFRALVIVAFSVLVLYAYWGNDPLSLILVVFSESLMVNAIGMVIESTVRNEGVSVTVLNALIPAIGFFGGAYVPVESVRKIFGNVTDFSPLTWINKAMFGVIYDSDTRYVVPAAAICLGIALVAMLISAFSFTREET